MWITLFFILIVHNYVDNFVDKSKMWITFKKVWITLWITIYILINIVYNTRCK